MATYTIVKVLFDGDEESYWDYQDDFIEPNEIVSTDASTASLEELVSLCDLDAESCNAHDFCGMHRLLGAVLYRQHGRESATATLLQIAQYGGLHGMGGICREGDAYEELGVGQSGHHWEGSFGD